LLAAVSFDGLRIVQVQVTSVSLIITIAIVRNHLSRKPFKKKYRHNSEYIKHLGRFAQTFI
jgi:hypothetical protein